MGVALRSSQQYKYTGTVLILLLGSCVISDLQSLIRKYEFFQPLQLVRHLFWHLVRLPLFQAGNIALNNGVLHNAQNLPLILFFSAEA